jgi:hypothetical protein
MLAFIIPAIIFLFLVVGAVVFVVCVLIAPLRRFALSAALWCATWGPCLVTFLLLAGTAAVAESSLTQNRDMQTLHAPKLLAALGWGYLTAAVLSTTAIATLAAGLHQAVLHRLTFPLFRLYSAAVCAGIGSVFGWCLGWLLAAERIRYSLPLWAFGMVLLVLSFGSTAYKEARTLRGEPPTNFTWITAEEFNGN